MHRSPEWRSGVFTGAGVLLVAIGIFAGAGWPFVVGGLVLLFMATASR